MARSRQAWERGIGWAGLCLGWFLVIGAVRAELVAHFALDEGSIDRTTNGIGSSVGGWTGAVFGLRGWVTNNLAAVPGGTGAGLELDATPTGIDAFVFTDFPGITGSGARTVSAWIRGSLPQPNFAALVSWGRNERAARYTFRLETAAGANEGRLRLEASGQAILGDTVVLDGQWHQVAAVTPAGGSIHSSQLYVDGVPQVLTRVGTAAPVDTKVDPLVPGERVSLGNGGWMRELYGWNGILDEVRIYDEALDEVAVRELASLPESPPVLVAPLAEQSFILGDPEARITLRAAARGRGPLTYAWQHGEVALPDQTQSSLNLQPVTAAHAGVYHVTVSNSFGFTEGETVVRVTTGPLEPTQQTALVGGSATFAVRMPAVSGYTYQWEKQGIPVVGATGPELVRINLKLDDTGEYRVRVRWEDQEVVSDPVTLQVVLPPTSTYPATVIRDGAESYWRMDDTNGVSQVVDQLGPNDLTLVNFLGIELGQPGVLAEEGGAAVQLVPARANYLERVGVTELNDVRSFSVEAWVRPQGTSEAAVVTALANLPSTGYQVSLVPGPSVRFRTGASVNPAAREFDDLIGGSVTVGEWNHVVATYDGSRKRLFLNGSLVGEQSVAVRPSPSLLFRLGAGNGSGAPGTVLNGLLDEVAFYRRALDPIRILTHYIVAGRSQAGVLVFFRTGAELNLVWGDAAAVLESAPHPEGAWEPIPGAVSPFVLTLDQDERWFRLRQP